VTKASKNQQCFIVVHWFFIITFSRHNILQNHPDLDWFYNNISKVYDRMDDYLRAFSFYERALDMGQHSLSTNRPHFQLY